MGKNQFVIIQEDMPWAMQDQVLRIIQACLATKNAKKNVQATIYSASEFISRALQEVEEGDWQVVVVNGSFTSTVIHRPRRLLTVRFKPYTVLVFQSKILS